MLPRCQDKLGSRGIIYNHNINSGSIYDDFIFIVKHLYFINSVLIHCFHMLFQVETNLDNISIDSRFDEFLTCDKHLHTHVKQVSIALKNTPRSFFLTHCSINHVFARGKTHGQTYAR